MAEDDEVIPQVIKPGEEAIISYAIDISDYGTFYVYSKGRISLGERNTNGCEARIALYGKNSEIICFYGATFEVIGVTFKVRPHSNLCWGPAAMDGYIPDTISWSWIKNDGNPEVKITDGFSNEQTGRLRSLKKGELAIVEAMSIGMPPPEKR